MLKKYFYLLLLFCGFSSIGQESATIFTVARSGTLAEAQKLFKQNNKVVNQINDAGYSPLILACYRGNTEVVKFLINN
jgi:ankyrin repeat protein